MDRPPDRGVAEDGCGGGELGPHCRDGPHRLADIGPHKGDRLRGYEDGVQSGIAQREREMLALEKEIIELRQDLDASRDTNPSWDRIATIIGVPDTDDVEERLRELAARSVADPEFEEVPEPGRVFSIRVVPKLGYEEYVLTGGSQFQVGELIHHLRQTMRHVDHLRGARIPMFTIAENDEPRP